MSRRLLAAIIALVVLALGIALVVGLSGNSAADNCRGAAATHHYTVTISNGKTNDTNLSARRCDTLTFTNKDAVAREIAFGVHSAHVPYDGVAERVLNKDQSLTITLNKTGTYHWHDHLHDEIQGYFSVM